MKHYKTEQKRNPRTLADKVFDFIVFFIVTAVLIAVALPLAWVFYRSLYNPDELSLIDYFIRIFKYYFANYFMIFQIKAIVNGFRNSFYYVLTGTVISVVLTIMAAYLLSRKENPLRNFFSGMIVFTMFFNGGLIPLYFVIRALGLFDSFWVMVLPGAIPVMNVIITRTYFQANISEELCDASKIDGCDYFRILFHVYLPLSKPIIAVNVLFDVVAIWNSYFYALVFLQSSERFPLQLVLRDYLTAGLSRLTFPLVVLTSLPMIIIYPFVQKYFIKGIMIGSIKG
jgi:putative aldouronate transport system permease protein